MDRGRLDELVDLVTAKATGRKRAGFPYVGLEHIEPGARTLMGIAPSSVSESTNGVFERGDILFGKLRPNLRKAVHVDFDGYCSTDFLVLRPKADVDSRYAFHAVASEAVFRHAERNSIGTGMPRTSWLAVSQAQIWVPPLDEQRRIAEVLDTIDETIQATERVVFKLKVVSEAWDQEFMSSTADTHTIRLGDACKVLGGKRLPSGHSYVPYNTQYRYLKVEDFFQRSLNYSELSSISSPTFDILNRYEIKNGELFISIAGSIGFVGINNPPGNLKTILTENAAKIVPSGAFISEYLALQLNSSAIASQIKSEIGTGGGVPKLALHRIASLRVTCPDMSEQLEAVRRHKVGHEALTMQEKELEKLKKLRTGLAEDLLSGRVRTVAG